MKKPKHQKDKTKEELEAYLTLAIADPNEIDPDTKVTIPSEDAVEEIRIWSIENKK